jgi:hypothetical protein
MVASNMGSNARIFLQKLWPRPEWVIALDLRPKNALSKKLTSWI